MNEDLEKLKELLLTDETFAKKLQAAFEAYSGEKTEESVFNNVLVPVAAEYGITPSFDEFKDFINNLSESELDKDELSQIAGGNGGGLGVALCLGPGVGIGAGAGSDGGDVCFGIGVGYGSFMCTLQGDTEPF